MTFNQPWLLLALIPVAALLVGYLIMQARRTRYAVRFATLPMLDKVAPKRPGWRRHVAGGLALAALSAGAVAAADPQVSLRVPYERATVIVAIDISGSMRASDVAPDRLEAAKVAAAAFVEELPDTFNVGVVAFAGSASLVAPASTDHQGVRRSIEALSTAAGGTAVGEAVFTSVGEAVRQAGLTADGALPSDDPNQPAEPVPARLVLLSDGANTSGRSPEQAAPTAVEAGMPVFTIAYGTATGTISQGGRQVAVPVDEATLQTLAEATSGQFYRAESSDQLQQVYADIGSSIGWRTQVVPATIPLILFGLGAATIAAGLSLRWFNRIV